MLKAALNRLTGLLCAVVALIPASTSLIKGIDGHTSNQVLHLMPFNWVAAWMPAIRCPMDSLQDLLWSLPGITAFGIVGFGLSIAFGMRKIKATRRWEDSL